MDDGSTFAGLVDMAGALGRGRPSKPLRVEYVRDLEPEDLLRAVTEGHGQPMAPLKALRQSHHQVAKLLAQGLPQVEIAMIVGITPERITQLKSDPSFVELMTYYADMEAEGYELARADMHARLASVGFDSLEILHERLHDAPEKIDTPTLLKIVEATADRTGHGKTSTVNHNATHSLSDSTLRRIREVTDAGHEIAQEDRVALLRIADRQTQLHSQSKAPDRVETEGSGVREEGGEGADGEVIEARFVVRVPPVD